MGYKPRVGRIQIRLNRATNSANPVINNPVSNSIDNGNSVSFRLIFDCILKFLVVGTRKFLIRFNSTRQ